MAADEIFESTHEMRLERERKPLRQFRLAVSLYFLWCSLAWLSNNLEQTTLTAEFAMMLLVGIGITNLFFLSLARTSISFQLPEPTITTAQCVLGISWGSLYIFLGSGTAELALGIYTTAMLFAIFQVDEKLFEKIAGFAAAAYVSVTFLKGLQNPTALPTNLDIFRLLIFLGVLAWTLYYARNLYSLREKLLKRNDHLRGKIDAVSISAERDHLTKSFNRHYIMACLEREKGRADRSNNPFSVCIFDLDHFKSINDEYGHLVGDIILKGFAKRVRSELRSMDAVNPSDFKRSFGRFGGEEFIVVLPSTGLHGAERCADRIRATIDKRLFDDKYTVTCSGGVAEYKRGESISDVLSRADQALYEAKKAGRNKIKCSEPKRIRKSAAIMDLRRAINSQKTV